MTPDRTSTEPPALFRESVLMVNQKTKLVELTNEYMVCDQDGNHIAGVAEVGQSALKVAARFMTSLDQFLTHSNEIRDEHERPLMVLVRPRKLVKSKFSLTRPTCSREAARIVVRPRDSGEWPRRSSGALRAS